MVNLKLDLKMLERLLNDAYEGKVLRLLEAWDRKYGDGPNKSTVHRWLNGKSSPKSYYYCRLCGLLDIDPFVLLKFDQLSMNSYFDLRNYVINKIWEPIKILTFIEKFVGNAHKSWPPNDFLNKYYSREWSVVDFKHDDKVNRNFYQEIELISLLEKDVNVPVVYHFAFLNQRPSVYWNQYGFIVRHQNQHRLFHINGETQSFEEDGNEKKARAETWFGQYGADFRVASIHPFELELVKSSPESVEKLRFR